jgi:hypothetical protein
LAFRVNEYAKCLEYINTQTKTIYYSYSDLNVKLINNISLEDINTTENLNIVKIGNSIYNKTEFKQTDKLYLEPGNYRISASISGYKDFAQDVFIKEDYSLIKELAFTPLEINKQGTIAGYVYNKSSTPVENALVSISGGAITNGYFSSVETDENGYYKITSINLMLPIDFQNEDQNLEIDYFNLKVYKDGYETIYREKVIVLEDKEREEIFYLTEKAEAEIVYKEQFESINNWVLTGLWNRINLTEASLKNNIFGKMTELNGPALSLAPNDESEGEMPKLGNVLWFGDANNTAYLEELYTLHGHSSKIKHSGIAESPYIDIPEGNITLSFNTWWEIESVNPNQNGFDLMEVYIIEEGVDYTGKCQNGIDDWLNDSNKYDKALIKYGVDKSKIPYLDQISYIYNEWVTHCGSGASMEDGDLVKKLNPAIDPPSELGKNYNESAIERQDKPFSSGGFNRAPILVKEELDLSKYSGKRIKLKFRFNTVDTLYNGFRGWIIDDVKIEKK